jgi:hypothetical protein
MSKSIVYFPGLIPSQRLLDYGPELLPSDEYIERQLREARSCIANSGRLPKKRPHKDDTLVTADKDGRIKPGINCPDLVEARLVRARLILSLEPDALKWFLHLEVCSMQTKEAEKIRKRKLKER